MSIPKKLRLFESHGCSWSGETGDQVYGVCPFTGKQDKFYVNRKNLLWDSKTAGLSGNKYDFLRYTSDRYEAQLTPKRMEALAADRRLPVEAFAPWHIGWNGRAYTIPVRDVRGRVVDIRMYKPGGPVISTPQVSVGLLGSEWLPKFPGAPVYVCEGEWDAIALRWLLARLKVEGVVVALPGAGVLKPDWVPWLAGRRVHTLYDHDGPGEAGEHTALERLKGQVQLLTFVHWPSDLSTGFDVRDWIIRGAIEKPTPKKCWRALTEMFRDVPRRTTLTDKSGTGSDDTAEEQSRERGPDSVSPSRTTSWVKPPTLSDVHKEFKKWLYLDSTDAIDIMLASVVSQQIDGEPIWMFLVGPPGSAKTETLNSLAWVPNAYMTSSLTPHSLISGANAKENSDPSLIPRLDGKVMVVKDFTSILTMRDADKDEIFGILRDAYDGKCGKEFGNGVVRNYESRFSVLAAVTPSIYALSSQHTALGERFLKFGVGDNLVHRSEEQIIDRAINNINQETTMREDLADVVHAFLTRTVKVKKITPDKLPELTDAIKQRIIHLARFGARMRGTVTRDTFRNDVVTSRPSAEVGSRLGKQLAKLCQSLAVIHRRQVVSLDDFRLAKKVMLDTIPQRTEDMLRHMLVACPTTDDTMTASELAVKSRYPIATVARIVQDLNILDIIQRGPVTDRQKRRGYTVSKYIRECIEKSDLYKTEEEMTRPVRISIRIIRRRKRKKEQPS